MLALDEGFLFLLQLEEKKPVPEQEADLELTLRDDHGNSMTLTTPPQATVEFIYRQLEEALHLPSDSFRSEERRVGKEC